MLEVLALARFWWKAALGIALGAALAFPIGHGIGHRSGVRDERAVWVSKAEAAKARNDLAVSKADAERPRDEAAVSKIQKDLNDAYAASPDSLPSAARVALACERLRLQNPGRSLPASCRPGR